MARRSGKLKQEEAPLGRSLAAALRFVAIVAREHGEDYQHYVAVRNRQVFASNGILSVGTPIDEDITATVHAKKLAAALARCGLEMILAQGPHGIVIRSGGFKAVVPTLDDGLFPLGALSPDIPLDILQREILISDALLPAFRCVAPLVKDSAKFVVEGTVNLKAYTCVSTDRILLFEYAHGHNLPSVVIPKEAIAAILRAKKPLTHFGFSQGSATFWFDDRSWLKTALHSDKYPDTSRLFEGSNFIPRELPPHFFSAVEAVLPHSDNGAVYLHPGYIRSHRDAGVGAEYAMPHNAGKISLPGAKLLEIAPFATHADLLAPDGRVYFEGKDFRAMLATRSD